MRVLRLLAAIAVLSWMTACSFDAPGFEVGGGRVDARAGVDAADEPDADPLAPDGAPKVDLIGAGCPRGDECSSRLTCLDERLGWWPTTGFCTKDCAGPEDCDAGSTCMPNWDGFQVCIPDCVGGGCGAGRVCTEWLDGQFPLETPGCLPGNPTAIDGSACTTFGDCPADRFCLNNPFEWPAGYCTLLECTSGSCLGDATCVNLDVSICLDVCTSTPACRASAGYECVTGIVGGVDICVFQHLAPGDACDSPAACGGAAWECLTGTQFPGGYCGKRGCSATAPDSCPLGMHCYDPTGAAGDEYCIQTCDVSTECRQGEGYACRPTGGGMQGCRL